MDTVRHWLWTFASWLEQKTRSTKDLPACLKVCEDSTALLNTRIEMLSFEVGSLRAENYRLEGELRTKSLPNPPHRKSTRRKKPL